MSRCQYCEVDGHDICWDTKPDRTCSCCLDTWFGMLCEPTRPAHRSGWVLEDFDEWSELTKERDAYRADAEAERHRNPYT